MTVDIVALTMKCSSKLHSQFWKGSITPVIKIYTIQSVESVDVNKRFFILPTFFDFFFEGAKLAHKSTETDYYINFK